MQDIIVVQAQQSLRSIIKEAIQAGGPNCDLNHIDVSRVENMNGLFYNLPFHGNISQWDTGRVTSMGMMFSRSDFNGDISHWNTSSCTDMSMMFANSPFAGDLSNWDVSNVTDMMSMFEKTAFNGDVSRWNTGQVRDIRKIFCDSPFSGDISTWTCENAFDFERMVPLMGLGAMTHVCVAHWAEALDGRFLLEKAHQDHLACMTPLALGLGLSKAQTIVWMHKTWLDGVQLEEALALPGLEH